MTAIELLERLVKAHDQWAKERDQAFRENLSTYDPVEGDQPCSDAEMDDYDAMEAEYAFDAQNTWTDFAAEARKILEMESK